MNDPRPLGLFDSGVGGLSVLRELRARLPHEDILYLADTAHLPYGTRPPAEIRALTERACRFLVARGAKAVVVACNTASTNALPHLRAQLALPIIGLVPTVKPAVALTQTGVIGVLATQATAHAAALHDVIAQWATPNGVRVVTLAPPGLVEAVERAETDCPTTDAILRPALAALRAENADVLVLGCTHFPFLRPALARLAGDWLTLVDSGAAVAQQTARVVAQTANADGHTGQTRFFTTAPDITRARAVIAALLAADPETITVEQAMY